MMCQEIWAVVNHDSGSEWGIVSHCTGLIKRDERLCVVLAGKLDCELALSYGAAKAYIVEAPENPCKAGRSLAELAREMNPKAILFSADHYGRMMAATAAALLRAGLAADCTEVARENDGLFRFTRPAFGDSLFADIICPSSLPQMATIRQGRYPAHMNKHDYSGIEKTVVKQPREDEERIVLLERKTSKAMPLENADLIVAGGLGIGSCEGFSELQALATMIGGALGASRGAVNQGLAPYSCQIGLTGKSVHPKLYLALGISGAVQHLVGMERAGVVVAVNNDPQAPIFEYADFAIVDDWKRFVGALRKRLAAENNVTKKWR